MPKNVNAKKYLMDKKLEEMGLEHLKCKKMYERNIMDFLLILDLDFWKDEKYKNMLTSSIWYSTVDNIIEIMTLEYWNIPCYNRLLKSSIFVNKAKNVRENIELFEKLGIGSYLRINDFRRTSKQNLLLIKAMQEKSIPVIVTSDKFGEDNCLNPIFDLSVLELKNQYGIDLEQQKENKTENNMDEEVIENDVIQKSELKHNNAKEYFMNKKLKEMGLEYLKNKQMYKRSIMDFLLILDLEFWNEEKYKHLLCSNLWYSSIDNIIKIITLEYWNFPKYKHLLGPTIFDYNAKNIKDNIELFTNLGIDEYLRIKDFRRTAIKNLLLINALKERCIPIIVKNENQGNRGNCLNRIFDLSNSNLKKQYGIDLELLEAEYEIRKGKK